MPGVRTIPRALLLCVVAISIAAGCVTFSDPTSDESPTPQCTLPSQNAVDVNLIVADAFAYGGKPAAVRFVAGTQVLACSTAMIPVSGDFELNFDGFGPMGDAFVELVLSSDASAVYGSAGDFTQRFDVYEDGTFTPDAPCAVHAVWDLVFSLTGATSQPVTWEPGVACPGQT